MNDTSDKAGRAGPRLDVRPAYLRGFGIGCWLLGIGLGSAAGLYSSYLLQAAAWLAHGAACACIDLIHRIARS